MSPVLSVISVIVISKVVISIVAMSYKAFYGYNCCRSIKSNSVCHYHTHPPYYDICGQPALPTNIRLGWKGMAVANTLAYYDTATSISFIVQAIAPQY